MKNLVNQLETEQRRVDFDSYDISVKELVSMAHQGIIDIAPEYQRQFRWPEQNQSRFIESVLLGIPVPSLFMAANKDGSWELIDGVQRLSTLLHFIGSEEVRDKFNLGKALKLTSLDVLTEFNDTTFEELPQTLRLKFSLRPLKVTTLSDKSDAKVRFDLFERLNTGGVKLTDQEIRACVFRGRFNDFIEEISLDENFDKLVNLTEAKNNDGTKQEYALRFFAYLNNKDNFDHSVVGFLNDYMAEASVTFNYRLNKSIFIETFSALSIALPNGIHRGNRRLTPVNLFEAISVGAALAIKDGYRIENSNVEEWISDPGLTSLTAAGTNNKRRLMDRINFCYERFKI